MGQFSLNRSSRTFDDGDERRKDAKRATWRAAKIILAEDSRGDRKGRGKGRMTRGSGRRCGIIAFRDGCSSGYNVLTQPVETLVERLRRFRDREELDHFGLWTGLCANPIPPYIARFYLHMRKTCADEPKLSFLPSAVDNRKKKLSAIDRHRAPAARGNVVCAM